MAMINIIQICKKDKFGKYHYQYHRGEEFSKTNVNQTTTVDIESDDDNIYTRTEIGR